MAESAGASVSIRAAEERDAPAIGFYRRLGAELVDDFMAGRLEGETLRRAANAE